MNKVVADIVEALLLVLAEHDNATLTWNEESQPETWHWLNQSDHANAETIEQIVERLGWPHHIEQDDNCEDDMAEYDEDCWGICRQCGGSGYVLPGTDEAKACLLCDGPLDYSR